MKNLVRKNMKVESLRGAVSVHGIFVNFSAKCRAYT